MVNVRAHEPNMAENTANPIADPTTSTEKNNSIYKINASNQHYHSIS